MVLFNYGLSDDFRIDSSLTEVVCLEMLNVLLIMLRIESPLKSI